MSKITASEETTYATSRNIVHPSTSQAACTAAEVAAAARIVDLCGLTATTTGKIKKST